MKPRRHSRPRFDRRAPESQPNNRTATIKALYEAEKMRHGGVPSAETLASIMAMSVVRVEFHLRILGLIA
jgi:hypothetical protein